MTAPPAPERVLLVEDDPETRSYVATALREEGYLVLTAGTVHAALARAAEPELRLLVLDVGLPDGSGFSLCERLRAEGFRAPILMLTARSDVASRVQGLEMGADDYLGKPFALAELKARVRALLRRSGATPSDAPLERWGLVIDARRRRVTRDGKEVPLTRRELDLLTRLLRARGSVVPRDTLLEDVWGEATPANAASLEVIVSRLRRKLAGETGTDPIRNVRGIGYRLESESP